MDKKKMWLFGGIGLVIFAVAFGYMLANNNWGHTLLIRYGLIAEDVTTVPEEAGPPSLDDRVEEILANMSDSQKIGQMMMIGIKEKMVEDNVSYLLNEYHIGGVILFDRNMDTVTQVQLLTGDLQKRAKQADSLPLFIALDEEGGKVVRMKQHLSVAPSAEELGKTGNPQLAVDHAQVTAGELKSLGINVNFAPDADLALANGRSYSRDPAQVISFVTAIGNSYQRDQLLFGLKHFPGIGKSKVDSHLESSEIMVTRDELEKEDMAPFRSMIRSMNNADFFVMVSHLKYPALDVENPASLSPAIIQGILRTQLAFQGLIITDDLEMGAVAKLYPFDELGVKAVLAGADIVLVCHEYDHEIAVYNGMLQALREGRISRQRVDESVRRILKVKLLHLQSFE